jgi:hypothetical protein
MPGRARRAFPYLPGVSPLSPSPPHLSPLRAALSSHPRRPASASWRRRASCWRRRRRVGPLRRCPPRATPTTPRYGDVRRGTAAARAVPVPSYERTCRAAEGSARTGTASWRTGRDVTWQWGRGTRAAAPCTACVIRLRAYASRRSHGVSQGLKHSPDTAPAGSLARRRSQTQH